METQSKSRHKLNPKAKRKVDPIVKHHPKLTATYKAKNYFLAILRMRSVDSYLKNIPKWIKYIEKHRLYEFYFIKTTLTNWHTEILNIFSSHIQMVPLKGSIEPLNKLKI